MHFPHNHILIIGGTSGIGLAMAEKFLAEGKAVILVGRREERLKEIVEKHKPVYGDRIVSYTFDITKLEEIHNWVEKVSLENPKLDAIFLNSGIQRGFNFSRPETVDLSILQTELTTNYTSYVYLTHAFLPILFAKNSKTALIYVSSGLSLVPFARCPNYCATKAALHHFLISLRIHLQATNVQVLEIIPPAVQTELHDKEFQPDIENGREIGMPLAAFVEETWQSLQAGNSYGEFPIGGAKEYYAAIEPGRKYCISKLPQAPAAV